MITRRIFAAPAAGAQAVGRDPRIDALRGLALIMIYVDHIPGDRVNLFTLHNFGFCDAAEIFVLLAGLAATLAYGRAIERDGFLAGLRRVGARCLRIYLVHVALVLASLVIVWQWASLYHMDSQSLTPLLNAGVQGLGRVLTLRALPEFFDILPLYIVLLGLFPLLYIVLQRSVGLALAVSGSIWLLANAAPGLNLPNLIDGKGWYFDPFTWQFLFTIGAALAVIIVRNRGSLPPRRGWRALAWLYLGFALLQGGNWQDWNLPNLQLFPMAPPDKSLLSPLRILDILAVIYLVLTSAAITRLMRTGAARILATCGRHSLEVFATGCLLALIARLIFTTNGSAVWLEIGVNVAGLGGMLLVAHWLERSRLHAGESSAAGRLPRPHFPTTHVGVR